jgi:uncharacterized C2H2 Zn-finger protein
MGCKTQVNEITLPIIRLPKSKVKVRLGGHDYICPVCGIFLRNRSKNYKHQCQQPTELPQFQQVRLDICNQCEHNNNGICLKEKEVNPDKPGLIIVGIKLPYVACRLKYWDKLIQKCPRCQSNHLPPCIYCNVSPIIQ